MKPDTYYKLNGKKYPVFKTPIEKKVINEILLNDIGEFIVYDNGKIKAYNTYNNLPQQFNLFEGFPTLSTTSILKLGLISVVGIWVYRLGRFSPNLNPFKVDKEYVKKMREKYKDLNQKRYNGTKVSVGKKEKAEGKTSATLPNGWVIENPNPN